MFTKDGYGDDYYLLKSREAMFEYLFGNGNITATEAVGKINRIFAVHNFSIDTDESVSGLIIFIVVLITLSIMILSVFLIFIKSLIKYFEFLPKDMWIVSIIGSVLIMSAIFTLYGNITVFKCHIRLTCIFGGFYVFILPILWKLIINIPETNSYSIWIQNHLYSFISLMTLVEILIQLSRILIPLYKVNKIIIIDGNNFMDCSKINGFGSVVYYFEVVWLLTLLACILFLVFIEWNIKMFYFEIRCIIASIFITILSFIMFLIVFKFNIKNYIAYNSFYACTIYVLSLSNYFFIYGVKLFRPLIRNKEEEERNKVLQEMMNQQEDMMKSTIISNDSNNDTNTYKKMSIDNYVPRKVSQYSESNGSTSTKSTKSTKKTSKMNHIMRLHYRESTNS